MPQVSVSIDVSDMNKALDFYEMALGCEVSRRDQAISLLAADNVSIYLLFKESGSNPLITGHSSRDFTRHWTPVHLDFAVDNIESTISKITMYGGSHEGSDSADWGTIAYCADPFGNGFCIAKVNQ